MHVAALNCLRHASNSYKFREDTNEGEKFGCINKLRYIDYPAPGEGIRSQQLGFYAGAVQLMPLHAQRPPNRLPTLVFYLSDCVIIIL